MMMKNKMKWREIIMEIQVTTNMQDVIRETMEAEMNICYLLTKGTLTPEE